MNKKTAPTTSLEQAIITSIHRSTGGKTTGYDLAKSLYEKTGWSASHQQIYRKLSEMTTSGNTEFKRIEGIGKPDAKLYKLTALGEELRHEASMKTEFSLETFRSKMTVMLSEGSVFYFETATKALNDALSELQRNLKKAESPLLKAFIELELEHRKVDLQFADKARAMLCAK